MYFYGYRQHQPHAFVNKQTKLKNGEMRVIVRRGSTRAQPHQITPTYNLSIYIHVYI